MDSKLKILLQIILPYFVFSALYVFCIDKLKHSFQSDPDTVYLIETYNSWIFVTLYGILLVLFMPPFNRSITNGINDILEKQIAEEAATKKNYAPYVTTFDNLPVGIAQISLEGRIMLANPAFTTLLGYAKGALTNHAFYDLVLYDDRPDCKAELEKLGSGEAEQANITLKLNTKSGDIATISACLTPVKHTGRAPLYLLLTASKTAEAIRNEFKLINHPELATETTPEYMTAMATPTEIEPLQKPANTPSYLLNYASKAATEIYLTTTRLLKTLQGGQNSRNNSATIDIAQHIEKTSLYLSIIAGIDTEEVVKTEIVPAEIINDSIKQLKNSGLAGGVMFKVNAQSDIVYATSPLHFQAIVDNIIANAVQFRKEGNMGHQVNVSFLQTGNDYQFVVKDIGEGMTEEDQQRMFDMYYRGNQPMAGEGLGLYVVKKCVDKLHGSIEVESKPKSGTEITVSLPMEG
ncbi:MAG: PAS domain S-box protein [Chitinophagia bacterium]|nr:PAS domain S-box protein [Chitinophagia bacterium]